MQTRIKLEEAISIMKEYSTPIQDTEIVSIWESHGRILAKDYYAKIDQPPFNKSALDGYCFNYLDLIGVDKEHPKQFQVVDHAFAGENCITTIKENEAIHIMTGGKVPEGCNCVIRQEDTNNDPTNLVVYTSEKENGNICLQGEDYHQGDLLIPKDTLLDYAALGIIASNGDELIEVYRPLKVALCTTGDELLQVGQTIEPGKIYDSNIVMLSMRLKELGIQTDRYKIKDDENECADLLVSLSTQYDLIITLGAVSVGIKDILHPALDQAKANKLFWRVLIKPGTPAIFSVLNDTPILSLSGNPFAATATFELLGRNLISYLTHNSTILPRSTTAILQNGFNKKSKIRRIIRAVHHDGMVTIPSGQHSSNAIKTLLGCNCLIDVKENSDELKERQEVKIWLM